MSEDYYSLSGEHYSTLKILVDRSAAHFAAARSNPKESTAPQLLGTATHWAVFEPEKFKTRIAIWEKRNGRRSGRAWDSFVAGASLARKEILTEAEHDAALRMAKAVRSSPQVRPYLEAGEAEKPITWIDAETGLRCKAKIDWVCRLGLSDLKTTWDASPEGFGRECARYGYHLQAGLYVDGYAASHVGLVLPYSIIAVENEPPHVTQVYRVSGEVLELGRARMREALRQVAALKDTPLDQWPGYSREALDLALPRWAMPYEDDLSEVGVNFEALNSPTEEA